MKTSMFARRRMLFVGLLLTFATGVVQRVSADNPKASGALEFANPNSGEAIFMFGGTERHIGRYLSYGEIDFVNGTGDTLEGTGVVVLTARNGDLLVGAVTAQLDLNNGLVDFHFSWRDSITLRNSTVVSNTGRFLKHRPPGLVVVATAEQQTNIVTILIRIIFGR
jgi:hypothetical protein